jgi:hypothetical protein
MIFCGLPYFSSTSLHGNLASFLPKVMAHNEQDELERGLKGSSFRNRRPQYCKGCSFIFGVLGLKPMNQVCPTFQDYRICDLHLGPKVSQPNGRVRIE